MFLYRSSTALFWAPPFFSIAVIDEIASMTLNSSACMPAIRSAGNPLAARRVAVDCVGCQQLRARGELPLARDGLLARELR